MKRDFKEFKSIFVSEDILTENEEHANIVTASTMLNLFWISVITWVLVLFKIFKVGIVTMNIVLVSSIILLLIPSIICYLKRGRGKWIKYMLFISFTILLAIADAILKYNVTLIMALPIILAARYYNKKFTLGMSIFTTFLFFISIFVSVKIGQQDLNSYNLLIPSGTNITINTTLRDALNSVSVNEGERLINIFIHFFIPKMLVFNILAFACMQISQSGKKMIKKQQEITKAGERIETELNLASVIQKTMLPSIFPPFPEHEEIDIYASMTPAKEVGGDFYDMFLIDDNHVAISIGDVSGKGIPASLIMMISKILIKNVSKIDMDVSKAFTRVNNMLCDGNETSIFVTSWFGILDLRNGKMEYVNAGHNSPLLYSKKNNSFEYIKTKPNLVLAGMENIEYKTNELVLEPGDRLFLYTDGVTEANNKDNKLYGEERLRSYLNSNIDLTINDTINGVKEDIDKFIGNMEQFDDITMLELIYKKRKEKVVNVTQIFTADSNELPKVHNFIKEELLKQTCDTKTVNQIILAAEEIFVNIANYAYIDSLGECILTISYDGKNKFKFIFEDTGIPFNPLEKENPDTTLLAKDRKVGGLGIFITKTIMDDISYKYENGKNILTITKTVNI